MSYKHTISFTVMVKLETEDRLEPDELEEIVQEIEYSFESEYGRVVTTLDEWDILAYNRSVKKKFDKTTKSCYLNTKL